MLKQMIVAGDQLSFVNGVLCAPGTMVTIDTDVLEPGPNLVEIGERPPLIPAAVAPIGPTGPFPTAPQQVPPGSLQTADGYASGPHLYVGPGSDLLDTPAADGDADAAMKADYAAFLAWRKERDAALADAPDDGGDAHEPEPEPEPFDADAVIDGNVPDVVARLEGLTSDELAKVRAAEIDREKPRQGVLDAIDAKG